MIAFVKLVTAPHRWPRKRGLHLPSIIVCGYESGGTTLVSELLRHAGGLSGFECGVLMCKSPAQFPKYGNYCKNIPRGWGVSRELVAELCTGTFEAFYDGLFRASFPNMAPDAFLFDKTPVYMKALEVVMRRAPFVSHCLVVSRDPRGVFCSWAKRMVTDGEIDSFVQQRLPMCAKRYVDYFIGLAGMRQDRRVLVIPFEDLVLDADRICERMANFCSRPIRSERTKRSLSIHVEGTKMNPGKVADFERFLSPATQRAILDACGVASEFFYREDERRAYADRWQSLQAAATGVLAQHGRPVTLTKLGSVFFSPYRYLLRNPDVLVAKADPVKHFKLYGRRQSRFPS